MHTAEELHAVIRSEPVHPSIVPAPGRTFDVWPGHQSTVDPSRVDRVQAALRTKLETMGGFDEAQRLIRKLFAESGSKGEDGVSDDQFVKIMVTKMNFAGYEADVKALYYRFDIDRTGHLTVDEFCSMLFGLPGTRATTAIGKVREILAKRAGGVTSLKSLGVQFKLLDERNDGGITRIEMEEGFSKFMRGFGIQLAKNEVEELFKLFDKDNSGTVSYDEFLRGVRGSMNDFRRSLVAQAYNVLSDGAARVTVEALAKKYDVSNNPMVKAGKITALDAVRAYMAHWHLHDKIHSDEVTLEDFVDYYDWISPSIDRDDYFELMIRNAWHIVGGEGWSENTSNLRVLVTHEDGHQSVETVKNDLGLDKSDYQEIKRRLFQQGIRARMISVKD